MASAAVSEITCGILVLYQQLDVTMTTETWMPVPEWEGWYEVSDMGRVRSVDREVIALNRRGELAPRKFKGKILAAGAAANGYRTIVLSCPVAQKYVTVHALVMRAFVGERPPMQEVCHADGNKLNNALSNLRYDTRKANAADSKAHGSRQPHRGEATASAKLTEEIVRYMRDNPDSLSIRALGRKFGVAHRTAASAIKGETWGHI